MEIAKSWNMLKCSVISSDFAQMFCTNPLKESPISPRKSDPINRSCGNETPAIPDEEIIQHGSVSLPPAHHFTCSGGRSTAQKPGKRSSMRNQGVGANRRSGSVRISIDSNMIFTINSLEDLSKFDKETMWFGKNELRSFIKNELSRRRFLGLTSKSVLMEEADILSGEVGYCATG